MTMRYQPQGLARLNRASPLARGLVFAAVPGAPELFSGVFPRPIGGGDITLFDQGKGFSSASNSTDGWYWPLPPSHPIYSITSEDTSFILMRRVAGASSSNLFGIPYRAGSWSTPFYAWTLATSSTTSTTGAYNYASSSSTRRTTTMAGFYTNGKTQAYGVARGGTRARYFAGGAQVGADVSIPAGSPDFVNRCAPVLFNRSSTSPAEGTTAQAAVVLIWNRELSPEEWKAVNDNPWQLFEGIAEDDVIQAASAPASIKITIGASRQLSSAPTVALKQRHRLAVGSSAQASSAALVALKQRHRLTVGASAQASSSPAILLSQPVPSTPTAHALALGSSRQLSSAPQIILKQRHRLAVGVSAQASASASVPLRMRLRLSLGASVQSGLSPLISFAGFNADYRLDLRRVLALGAESRALALGAEIRALDLGREDRILITQGG